MILAIASNKSDLEEHRMVRKEQAEEFAAGCSALHFETSAKDNNGVDELFKSLGEKVSRFHFNAMHMHSIEYICCQ